MNLYHIWQETNNNYDTYDSAIVAAESEYAAARIPVGSDQYNVELDKFGYNYHDGWRFLTNHGSWVNDPSYVKVELIGVAKEGTPSGQILASFNAG